LAARARCSFFYRHDGQSISGGIIVMAKADAGVETLAVPGSIKVMFELVE